MRHFFLIKPTRCTNFSNLFCHETLHVSDSSSVHQQEFIHCTLSNDICHRLKPFPYWSCSKAVYKPVWHIQLLSVQWINSWWWTEELSETCRFSCQNKFEKLVRLVGFIRKKFVTMHGHVNVKNTWGCIAIYLFIYLFKCRYSVVGTVNRQWNCNRRVSQQREKIFRSLESSSLL